MKQQITSIESAGFTFCRIGMMIIVWIAFLLKLKWLVAFSFVILLLSALLTVKYSPMIVLWRYTLGRLINGKTEILNVTAMKFAHSAGAVLSGTCVVLLYSGFEKAGWVVTGIFAIMKTISALGFCPASKLYVCMSNGGCCSLSKKLNEIKKK